MIKKLFGVLFVITLLISCKTGTPIKRLSGEGMMYAMIYDYENTPVSGVAIYINNRKIVDSDIQGRFILDKFKKGEYRIKLTKKGYETFEDQFQYDPLQVLYFKIINAQQLLVLAETALDNIEYTAAENYLDRALQLEPNRPDILYLKGVTCYLQGKNEEAAAILENMIKKGSNDAPVTQLLEKIRPQESEE